MPLTLLLLLALGCAAAPALGATAAAPAAATGSCQAQLAEAAPGADGSRIDADTPADACTFDICTGDYETCTGGGAPLSTLQVRGGRVQSRWCVGQQASRGRARAVISVRT